jgi:predicted dehydrogenase
MSSVPEEGRPIRWGIIGAGWIAEQVCDDIARTGGNVVSAVAARDAGRAAEFAGRHGASRSYGSYAELARDPEVDVVYVATTHPHHLEHSLLAIEAGKALLVEKPVALNRRDAQRIFDAAAAAGVFAMEAMWMRTNPLIRRAQELIAEGAIGEVVGLRHEFGLGRPFDPQNRVYDLDNGGGALLDVGIYPMTFAYLFLGGAPHEVQISGTSASTGADDTVSMSWIYDQVSRAQLWCSLSGAAPNEAAILGTKGWLRFAEPGFRPTSLTLRVGKEETVIPDPLAGHGYEPEIEEVERCLRAGLTESPLVTVADTLAVMDLLDGARRALGVKYPTE